jgi:hypothetical protein
MEPDLEFDGSAGRSEEYLHLLHVWAVDRPGQDYDAAGKCEGLSGVRDV